MTGKSYSKLDEAVLQVIVKYCEDIDYFLQLFGSDEEDFADNLPLRYGCVFSLMQIGEYVKRLSKELINDHEEIDWKGAAGLRDNIAHKYGTLDIFWIRTTILEKIPPLEKVCRDILNSY